MPDATTVGRAHVAQAGDRGSLASDVAVVGAGPGGLATAAMLNKLGVPALVLERGAVVGATWRRHYDRLRLNSVRWLSGLPGYRIPRATGRWPSRDEFTRYLKNYAAHHGIRVAYGVEVARVERAGDSWSLKTSDGELRFQAIVLATGNANVPFVPEWPGRQSYDRPVLHSSEYRNSTPYRGQTALVVGPGNSGTEIAMDLACGGAAKVYLSVRTPPNIMPRDVGPIPGQVFAVLGRRAPIWWADRVARRVQRIRFGDLSDYGLRKAPRGPRYRLLHEHVGPVIDWGFVDFVKQGRVEIVEAIDSFRENEIVVADGRRLKPQVVIAATGYRPALESLVGHLGLLRPDGRPCVHGSRAHPNAPGLYFIGFSDPPSGVLRELGLDARRIAKAIAGSDPSRRRPR